MALIRPLNEELRKKAITELFEVPDRIQDDLKALKDWISKQPHLKVRLDDQFLIAFIRGCKYSLERAKEKIDTFYSVRTNCPEFYKNRDPLNPTIADIISDGAFVPLPNFSGQDGVRLLLFKISLCDLSKYTFEECVKMFFTTFDIMLMKDDNLVIAGGKLIVDLSNLTLGHYLGMTPSIVMKSLALLQNALPLRQKGFHFLFMAPAFEAVFALVKRCLNEKNRNRIFVHQSLEDLHKAIPKELLPTEYGGGAGTMKAIQDDWAKTIQSYREYINEEANYGLDEKKRPGRPKNAEYLFGVDGSFRNLNVD